MRLVTALCTARAWDSTRAREYLPGLEYEIDADSPLASLTVLPVALDENGNAIKMQQGIDGKFSPKRISKPPYVFQFDRNETRTNEGVVVEKDYSCKKCGEKFSNLADLGRHSNMNHRSIETVAPETVVTGDEDEEEPEDPAALAARTCEVCGKVCKTEYGLRLHRERSAHFPPPDAAKPTEAEVATA